MSPWDAEEPEEGDLDEQLPDEVLPEEREPRKRSQAGPSVNDDDDDGFDDIPTLEYGKGEYDEFLGRELDAKGRVKGDPPVTAILIGVTVALLALALWLFS